MDNVATAANLPRAECSCMVHHLYVYRACRRYTDIATTRARCTYVFAMATGVVCAAPQQCSSIIVLNS